MEQFVINLDGWEKKDKKYIYPDTPAKSNWYLHGFVPKNDYTIDIYGWFGFEFETEISGSEEIEVKVETLEFREGRNVEVINTFTWKGFVAGNGKKTVTAKLSQFDLYTCEPNVWKYVRSVEINKEVENLRAIRGDGVYAYSKVMSKSAKEGEIVNYEIELANCTNETMAVRLDFAKKGWETLDCKIEPKQVTIEPFGTKKCILSVIMNERISAGGFEKQIVKIIKNGSKGSELEFYTVKYLEHPYIIHDDAGWQKIKEKTEKYEWAKNLFEQYKTNADEWEIPERDMSKPYLYITENAHKCFNSAIIYKLTGDIKYAKKSADFLLRVADKENGYPKTLRACHQQMVHEGEFFKSCAFTYDLIYNSGILSESEHADIEDTFRMLAHRMDWEISGGGISNWSLAMIAGAMYCSMCIQDRALIERFVTGVGGIYDHMMAGILPDGWWCECTIGYNLMSAGLFSEYAQALMPWGINLKDMWVPAQYAPTVQPRVQHMDGLSWDIYGKSTKNYRSIRDLWDSLVSMGDYRGVVIGVNDCAETKLGGKSEVGFDSRYDIAYSHYKDPAFAHIIRMGGDRYRCLLHGEGELPETQSDAYKKSCYFDNGGVSLLRSQTKNRDDREQYQGSLKYGSHGGAHGHYDRCSMNALSRFGKNFYNPESIWYTYGTFMYKFYVQNSITHNMVTTDLKLQEPNEGANLLFYSGEKMQVNAVENVTRWSNPPYGGWRVLMGEEFADRSWNEGRYMPIPPDAPEYTTRTDFTEPIVQRRLMVVTDEYAVNFDYVKGEVEHDFDCIYHVCGMKGIDGVSEEEYTEKLCDNPLSSAQLITGCTWYSTKSDTVKASFEMEFGEGESAKPGWRVANRSGYNEQGCLKLDVYYADTDNSRVIVGGDPEYVPVNKKLFYRVETDGKKACEGKFGAWILGRDDVTVDLENKKELKLIVRVEKAFCETDLISDFVKTIFWGDPYIVTKSDEKLYLSEIDYSCENVDMGDGAGVDYFGGKVTIQAKTFDKAIPSEPLDIEKEAVITVDLSGLDAVRFEGCIGGDYPLGNGEKQRKFLSQRKTDKEASFISVIEIFEKQNKVKSVKAIAKNSVRVELTDGSVQEITAKNLDKGTDISVELKEYNGSELICTESSQTEE